MHKPMAFPCQKIGALRSLSISLMVLAASLPVSGGHCQEGTPAVSILINGVHIAGGEDREEAVSVNILVKNRKLDIVTRDEISSAEATMILDATGGFLIGSLRVGELASFLILDQDPRENVEVLLDTRTHARFAIHEGLVLRNDLVRTEGARSTTETKRSRWLAYTPPPMALPMSYRDDTKWNRWETRYVSGIFLAAVVLDRQRWPGQNSASEGQVGDLTNFDGGEIRGLRFGAIGTINFATPWVYTIFAATNAFDRGFDADGNDDLSVFDYRLDVPLPGKTTLSVGKQKEPISMERLMSMVFIGMQERSSVSDAMLPARNVGIVWSGTGLGQRMSWAGGVFNDWFDAGQSFNNSSNQFVGRVTGLAFASDDESNLLHVGGGVRFSDANEDVRFQTEPEFNQAPLFVDTDDFTATNVVAYNAELTWKTGPIWVSSEYVRSNVDARALQDPSFSGYHVAATWALTGEQRRYQRTVGTLSSLPVAKSVYQNGWGAWEISTRWSDLDLTDGLIDGGRMKILSFGVNWWLTPVFNLNINYRHVELDRFGATGRSGGVNTRVVLMLE